MTKINLAKRCKSATQEKKEILSENAEVEVTSI